MNSLFPSLLLSSIGVSLLVLGENPRSEVKKLSGRAKDRSLIRSRLLELNLGSQIEYEEFRYFQFTYTSISALAIFTLSLLSKQPF